MHILLLGGTGFLGPATIAAALMRGHRVTAFNRGRHQKRLQHLGRELTSTDRLDILHGNRDPDKRADDRDAQSPIGLSSLRGRTFDAVIDTSGHHPRMVSASAEALADCPHYVFISSVARYADTDCPGSDESAAAATMADPRAEEMGDQLQNYGPLKALCEEAAKSVFSGRTTIVRPSYIVGPGDPMALFTYWPVRVSSAVGERREVLLPGPPDSPVQIIDVRDLAEWLVRLVENRAFGTFNACGPAERLTAEELMRASSMAAGTDPVFTWVPSTFVEEHGIVLPILSARLGVYRLGHEWSNARATAAGLAFRPILNTCKETLAWFNDSPEYRRRSLARRFLPPQIEMETLAAWHRTRATGGDHGEIRQWAGAELSIAH